MNMRHITIAAILVALASNAVAGSLRYEPLNPAFGGNPNTTSFFLGTAQIQNRFINSGGDGGGGGVPDIEFPPIVIDLGGLGGDAGGDPVDDTGGDPVDDTGADVTMVPAAQATRPILQLP